VKEGWIASLRPQLTGRSRVSDMDPPQEKFRGLTFQSLPACSTGVAVGQSESFLMKMMATGLLAASMVSAAAVPAALAQTPAAPAESTAQAPSDKTTAVTLVGKAKAEPRAERARKAKPKDRFLFAVVNFGGGLDRGFGVKNTLRQDTGSYQVFFNRDVRECSFVVSVSGTGTDDVHGVADAAHVAGKPKGLYVNTYGINVDAATNSLQRMDAPFHLQVMCAPG
jgi:hypothetical protein